MKGRLYEKLYKENEELKDTAQKRERYIEMWKELFGYNKQDSFDTVLGNLYEEKYGKKPY